ncbi:MAG: thiamine-phosphate kinase [bacterium]|nr:thiamine-phosphate kinase [bacterium]
MDEARFVEHLQERFPFTRGQGIGDDTSVVTPGGGENAQLVTKDLFIEGVHFSLDYYSIREAALKSLAVNLSDIAAMGGRPLYFYLGLGMPAGLGREATMEFFEGMEEGCKKWQVELAGGDFSTSPHMVVSITMVGEVQKPVCRGNARVGDLIGISGNTGESAVGLKLLQQGQRNGLMVKKHKNVEPEIEKGMILAPYVNSMLDVSDGILIDLKRILAASEKGAAIDYGKIPVTREMKRICCENGIDEYEAVLAGGEDYVLLFTVSPGREKALRREGIDYHIIGEITEKSGGLVVRHNGAEILPDFLGYDHFES